LFYIYAYLRKDGSPYYVGKGKNYRAYSPVHTVGVPKDKNRIVFWHSELHEQDAFDLEIFYIQLFGRKVDGGILRNMTLGGQGASGKKTSEKTKKLISARNKGSKRTPEARAKMALAQLGRKRGPMSQEQKDAISKAPRKIYKKHSGRSAVHREKLRIARKLAWERKRAAND